MQNKLNATPRTLSLEFYLILTFLENYRNAVFEVTTIFAFPVP